MAGPVYRGTSRAIKVSDCVEITPAPFPPGGEAGKYNGVSRAIKTLQNVGPVSGSPQSGGTGPVYAGTSRAIKVLLDCPGCECVSETFTRTVASGSWGDAELGPVGWVGTGVGTAALRVEDGVGKLVSGFGQGTVEWFPGVVSVLEPPYEYAFDAKGEISLEYDTMTVIETDYFHYIVITHDIPDGIHFSTVWASGPPGAGQGFVEGEVEGSLIPGDASRWVRIKVRVENSAVSGKIWYRDEPEPTNWHFLLVSGGTNQANGFYLTQFERWLIGWGNTTDAQFDNIVFRALQGDTIDSFLVDNFGGYVGGSYVGPQEWPGWTNVFPHVLEFSEAYVNGGFGAIYLDGADGFLQKITPTNVDLNGDLGWRLVTAFFSNNVTDERLILHNEAGAIDADDPGYLEINGDGEVWLGGQTVNIGMLQFHWYNLIWEYVPGIRSSVWIWDNLTSGSDKPPQPVTPTLEITGDLALFGDTLYFGAEAFSDWAEWNLAALNVLEFCPTDTWEDDFDREVADGWLAMEGNCPPWTPEPGDFGFNATVSVSNGAAHIVCIGNQSREMRLDSRDGPWAINEDFTYTTRFRATFDTTNNKLVVFGLGLDFEPVSLDVSPRSTGFLRVRVSGNSTSTDNSIAYTPGVWINVIWEHKPSLNVSRAKVWLDPDGEPGSWLVTRATAGDDYTTPLQRDGFSVFADSPAGNCDFEFAPMAFT